MLFPSLSTLPTSRALPGTRYQGPGLNPLSREVLPKEETDPGSLNCPCLETCRRGLQAGELKKAWGPSWEHSSEPT